MGDATSDAAASAKDTPPSPAYVTVDDLERKFDSFEKKLDARFDAIQSLLTKIVERPAPPPPPPAPLLSGYRNPLAAAFRSMNPSLIPMTVAAAAGDPRIISPPSSLSPKKSAKKRKLPPRLPPGKKGKYTKWDNRTWRKAMSDYYLTRMSRQISMTRYCREVLENRNLRYTFAKNWKNFGGDELLERDLALDSTEVQEALTRQFPEKGEKEKDVEETSDSPNEDDGASVPDADDGDHSD